jgi:hypothetical protein
VLGFQFALSPLADVTPWRGDRPTLHWFGLSNGWYWIEVDGRQLLRYGDAAVRRWSLSRVHTDYDVVRLWEDLLVLRRSMTEPVPADVVQFVDGTFEARHLLRTTPAPTSTRHLACRATTGSMSAT